ncbi:MAG: hypothetical protein OXH70_16765 [Acidobacteria bacterium]|nr:hypothetical protein [Acidobacteriota bacterium]MCY3970275.1 hypothetical protein [Acidobacteriota bacterium]
MGIRTTPDIGPVYERLDRIVAAVESLRRLKRLLWVAVSLLFVDLALRLAVNVMAVYEVIQAQR